MSYCLPLIVAPRRVSATHLLMLLSIADFADDDGRAYPSVASLARKCRMKPRNAQTILAGLRESGELVIRMGEGPKGTNLYRIQPLQDSAPLQRNAPGGAKDCAYPLQGIAPKPSVNHQEPPKGKAQAIPSLAEKKKTKREDFTLEAFIEHCKSVGEKPIPENDPIFGYVQKVGIDQEMLAVAWQEFKAAFLGTAKRQKDWRSHFRNAVRRNWYKLWFLKDGEQAGWTTAGEQARRAAA